MADAGTASGADHPRCSLIRPLPGRVTLALRLPNSGKGHCIGLNNSQHVKCLEQHLACCKCRIKTAKAILPGEGMTTVHTNTGT